MALGELLDSFFTEEWIRFSRGLAKLDPQQQVASLRNAKDNVTAPGQPTQISIPGWDDIVHLGPRYIPTSQEYAEARAARREGRAPNLSPEAVSAMARNRAVGERIRNSTQPAYAQAFGEIMTAIDNVQDLASTVSTFGRLGVWGIERELNALAPGLSAAAAGAAGRIAAEAAGLEAVAAFDAALRAGAKAGEPIAARLLADEIAQTAARAATKEAAQRAAYQLAFRGALLGLGTRVALRLLPIVGWALLAADLLNILNLLGMLAFPAYAALCRGPQEALVAGVPATVFKGVLKRETWKAHALNPFSRQARAARAAKAARGLPGIGALLEVAQTTDQLFGVGISLGGLVGVLMESAYGLERASRGEAVRVDISSLSGSYFEISVPGFGR